MIGPMQVFQHHDHRLLLRQRSSSRSKTANKRSRKAHGDGADSSVSWLSRRMESSCAVRHNSPDRPAKWRSAPFRLARLRLLRLRRRYRHNGAKGPKTPRNRGPAEAKERPSSQVRSFLHAAISASRRLLPIRLRQESPQPAPAGLEFSRHATSAWRSASRPTRGRTILRPPGFVRLQFRMEELIDHQRSRCP